MIFPRCGLTYGDLVATAGKCHNKKKTAEKLGASDNQLDRVVKRYDLNSIFSKLAGELFSGVTAADLLKVGQDCR